MRRLLGMFRRATGRHRAPRRAPVPWPRPPVEDWPVKPR